MADLVLGLVIAHRGLICQPVATALCRWARPLRRRRSRWIDHHTNQSLLMAPIDQILAGLASLWDSLASPAGYIGTEVL